MNCTCISCSTIYVDLSFYSLCAHPSLHIHLIHIVHPYALCSYIPGQLDHFTFITPLFIYQGSNARNMATRKECFLLKLHELLPAHVSPYTLFEIIKQWTLVIDYTIKLNCSTASLKIINTQLPAVVCKYI